MKTIFATIVIAVVVSTTGAVSGASALDTLKPVDETDRQDLGFIDWKELDRQGHGSFIDWKELDRQGHGE
jgi:hypothetical protein